MTRIRIIALLGILPKCDKIERGQIEIVHNIKVLYDQQIKTSINLLNQN